MGYYYKQYDRHNKQLLGLVSYGGERPTNDHPDIELEEITEEEYEAVVSAMLEPDETEGAEDNGE